MFASSIISPGLNFGQLLVDAARRAIWKSAFLTPMPLLDSGAKSCESKYAHCAKPEQFQQRQYNSRFAGLFPMTGFVQLSASLNRFTAEGSGGFTIPVIARLRELLREATEGGLRNIGLQPCFGIALSTQLLPNLNLNRKPQKPSFALT